MLPDLAIRIWIERLRHADGRPRYSKRGQPHRCRLGSADGEVLVEGCLTPALDACRALVVRGITGRFETWREGVSYACLRGDIEMAAMLDVSEEAHGPVFRTKRQEAAPGLVNPPPAPAEPSPGAEQQGTQQPLKTASREAA
jgi:hypothetical protein